jgi:hypothetical protein
MPFRNKYLHSYPAFELAGRQVKPYHLTLEAARPIPARIVDAAYAIAAELLDPPDEEMPPAGWLVLHEGPVPMYLCVYDWVWGNALEVRSAAAAEPFFGCPDDDPAHFIVNGRILAGCVWELAMLEHERSAWVRHVLAPGEPDLKAYLADFMPDGPIGYQRVLAGDRGTGG